MFSHRLLRALQLKVGSYRWCNCSAKGELPACSSVMTSWLRLSCKQGVWATPHILKPHWTGSPAQHRPQVNCDVDHWLLGMQQPPSQNHFTALLDLHRLFCSQACEKLQVIWGNCSAIRVSWQAGMFSLPYHLLLQHRLALGMPAGSPAVATRAAYSLLQPRVPTEETWTLQGQQLLSTVSSARLPV